MDIAIVAPCPIPYVIGGAENLWRGLQDHSTSTRRTRPRSSSSRAASSTFWELVDSYRRFAELDLTGFDVVVSSKYPAWMVRHPRHVVYMLHKLRGLYDTYHFDRAALDAIRTRRAAVLELRAFMAEHAGQREALPEFFERVDALRDAPGVRDDLFAFPGPFIRELVHWLDGVGLAPDAIRRYGAISRTVRERADYFPAGADVFVAPPADRARTGSQRASAGATCSPPAGSTTQARRAADRGDGARRRRRRAADRRHRARRGGAARAGAPATAGSASAAACPSASWRALYARRARRRVRPVRGGLRARHARGDAVPASR